MGRLLTWLAVIWILGTLAFLGTRVYLNVQRPMPERAQTEAAPPADQERTTGSLDDALNRSLETSNAGKQTAEEPPSAATAPPEAGGSWDRSGGGETYDGALPEKDMAGGSGGAFDELSTGAGPEASAPEPSPPPPAPIEKRAAPPPAAAEAQRKPSANQDITVTAAKRRPEIQRVTVYYGTDRTLEKRENVSVYGSVPSDKLDYGSVEVTLPPVHQRGELERPAWWRFEFTPDPEKHVVFRSFSRLKEDKFFTELKALVGKSKKKEAFVFIHGFNTSFDDAAMRTAQLSYDLNFDGAPIFYSWSSRAELDPLAYVADGNAADQTVPQLAKFLDLVAKRTGAERIHLLAHSMGNRALVQALADLERKAPAGRNHRPFRQIVLAAPDIDRKVFMRLAEQIQNEADNITLYASANDAALKAALKFNGFPRAGDATGGVVVVKGITSIDASAVATEFFSFGHSFFADTRSVLDDIRALMETGGLPEARGLHPVKVGDAVYWRIN